MSKFKDPIRDGLARGWKVLGGKHAAPPEKIHCDVAIIGSGAGSGITAELLARAGLSVVIIEEGPLKSSSDFNQLESEAYKDLYQEGAGRRTKDKAIGILQGRSVGGSTTVNWTSSFRTPPGRLQRGSPGALLCASRDTPGHRALGHGAQCQQRTADPRSSQAGHRH
jgi:choline dehydrogenase-like flavoprotein